MPRNNLYESDSLGFWHLKIMHELSKVALFVMVSIVMNFGQQFCTVLISRSQSKIQKTVAFTFFDFVSFTVCAVQAAAARAIALSEGKTSFTMQQKEQ